MQAASLGGGWGEFVFTVSRVIWPSWGRVGAVSKRRERLGKCSPVQQPNAPVHAPGLAERQSVSPPPRSLGEEGRVYLAACWGSQGTACEGRPAPAQPAGSGARLHLPRVLCRLRTVVPVVLLLQARPARTCVGAG